MVNETNRLGLSPFESKVLSDLSAEGKSIFTLDELSKKVKSKTKARRIASLLTKKNWLERINKGTYLILELGAGSKPTWTEDSFYIASKLTTPYYVGYLSMLNFYHWTEQIPITVTIAVTKATRNKIIHNTRYEFNLLSKKKFFGYKETNVRGHKVNVSDPEKTIVDALDHPEYCGGIDEVAKAITNATVDWEKVIEYSKKMKNGAIFKRMGFLLEKMEVPVPKELIEKIRTKITKGYSPLLPGASLKGKYNTKWNILINTKFSKEEVLA